MSYDKNNIKNTTEDGIADLVRDIISVPFSLDYVFTQIKFKPYHVKIKKALLERDEEDWSIAHLEDSIDSYKEYLSRYSRETPYYTGIHIVEAEEAIRKLKEAEQPIEPEVPIEPEEPIIPVEPKATNTQIAEIIHLISVSAHRKELDKEDNTDWLKATSENTVSSYLRYIKKHLDNPYGHVGKHVEEAKRQHLIAEDNSAWETARKVNTSLGYEAYLSKYKKSNGLYVRDAQNAILRLQEEKDWETACSENTLVSYKKFVTKYKALAGKYSSAYLSCAKKKIEELTPHPLPPHPKWTIILLALVLCWFLWIQWQDNAWPFNITKGEPPVEQDTTVIVKEVTIPAQKELYPIEHSKNTPNENLYTNKTEVLSDSLSLIVRQIRDNMVHVDGGTFIMGATAQMDTKWSEHEKPLHRVTVSSFYLCKYEVTQEEWEVIMGYNPVSNLPGILGKRVPVSHVSWDDCQKFISKLNEISGLEYRLPTEAEWEFAARGGIHSKNTKYSGSNKPYEVANVHFKNYGCEVGQRCPNELGIYDMTGNVSEWCLDSYAPYTKADQFNPIVINDGEEKVNRGAGWSSTLWQSRISNREGLSKNNRGNGSGLRLAVTIME